MQVIFQLKVLFQRIFIQIFSRQSVQFTQHDLLQLCNGNKCTFTGIRRNMTVCTL